MVNLTAKQVKRFESTATVSIISYDEFEDTFKVSDKISTQPHAGIMTLSGEELNGWLECSPDLKSYKHRAMRALSALIDGDTDIPHGLVGLSTTVDVYLPHERIVHPA